MAKKCTACGHQYSIGLPSCPQCGSRESIGGASSLEDIDALFGGHDAQRESAQHSHRGGEFFMKGDFWKAKIEFEAALKADPNSANDHESLGATLCKLRLYADAIPHLEKAIELHPGKRTAREFLAEAHSAEAHPKASKAQPPDTDRGAQESTTGLFSDGIIGLLNKGPIGVILFGLILGAFSALYKECGPVIKSGVPYLSGRSYKECMVACQNDAPKGDWHADFRCRDKCK